MEDEARKEPPGDLAAQKAWVTYKLTPDENGKILKLPFWMNGHRRKGAQNSPADLAGMGTYAEALEACRARGHDGVGFALREELGVSALDFDHCVEDGVVRDDVARMTADTYCEISPSGKGVRAFYQYAGFGNEKSYVHEGWPFGFETFETQGYVTFTGNVTPMCDMLGNETTIAPMNDEVLALFKERFGGSTPAKTGDDAFAAHLRRAEIAKFDDDAWTLLQGALAALNPERANGYDDCIRVGHALASLKGTPYEEDAREHFHGFCEMSDKYTPEWAESKWDSFHPSKSTFKTIFHLAKEDGWIHPGKAPITDISTLEDRSDEGNANILCRIADGNYIYVYENSTWLVYENQQWIIDDSGSRLHCLAIKVSQELYEEVIRLKKQAADNNKTEEERKAIRKAASLIESWVKQSRSLRGIRSMIALAQSKKELAVSINCLDRESHLLGVANGVVNLRTGLMSEAVRETIITKHTSSNYNPNARAPKWKSFINEITGEPLSPEFDDYGHLIIESVGQFSPRPTLARYIQKLIGYLLTAETNEQKMFIVIGDGSNGKSVLFDVILHILGDYAVSVSPKLFMASSDNGNAEAPSSAKARLAGARLALASEAEDRQRLEAPVIKQHTGDQKMTARLMRENEFQFDISHKVVLLTNAAPNLSHLDEATRGRLHLIPFDRRWNRPGHVDRSPLLPDGDKNLRSTLLAEAEGILAWAVQGAALYYTEGLEAPAEVSALTNQYFERQDVLRRWVDTLKLCSPSQGATASDLLVHFERWRKSQNISSADGPDSSEGMGRRLKACGYIAKSDGKSRKYPLRLS